MSASTWDNKLFVFVGPGGDCVVPLESSLELSPPSVIKRIVKGKQTSISTRWYSISTIDKKNDTIVNTLPGAKLWNAWYVTNKSLDNCKFVVMVTTAVYSKIRIIRIDDTRFKSNELEFEISGAYWTTKSINKKCIEIISNLISSSPGLYILLNNMKGTSYWNRMKCLYKRKYITSTYELKLGDIVKIPCQGIAGWFSYHTGVYIGNDQFIEIGRPDDYNNNSSDALSNASGNSSGRTTSSKIKQSKLNDFLGNYTIKDCEIFCFIIPFKSISDIINVASNLKNGNFTEGYWTEYNLFRRNCQHFAFRCVTGMLFSPQGDSWSSNARDKYTMVGVDCGDYFPNGGGKFNNYIALEYVKNKTYL